MNTTSKILLMCSMMLTGALFSCKKDPCADVSCLNGGSCNEGVCTCATGYEGATCNTEQRTKFLGSYTVSEACNSGSYNYTFTATISSAGVTRLLLTDFAAVDGSVISATVNGTTLTIAQQNFAVSGEVWGIIGSGQLNGNQLTIEYTLTFPDNTTDGCTATCTKQ